MSKYSAERGTVRYGATDALMLLVGFGVLPLAWVTLTNPFFSSFPASLIRETSVLWVPFGLLLLVMWFQDNPLSTLPVFRRFRGDIHTSPGLVGLLFPVVTLALFLALFSLTAAGNTILNRSGLSAARDSTFFVGLFTIMAGLLITFDWLGEKEDYSRTAYVMKIGSKAGSLGSRPFPRASPGPRPSERQREARKHGGVLADLFGVSVVIAGIMLMITSTFLG